MPFAMAQLASTLVKELPHILAKMWDSEEADGDEAQNGRLSDAICLGVAGAQPSNRTLAHVDQNVFFKMFSKHFSFYSRLWRQNSFFIYFFTSNEFSSI